MDAREVEDQVFPEIADRWLDQAAFKLLYQQHGGSGLALSITDVENMSVKRIRWWSNRLDDVRANEAEAVKAAQNNEEPEDYEYNGITKGQLGDVV